MKIFSFIVVAAILLQSSCTPEPTHNSSDAAKEEVEKTDIAFSKRSLEIGTAKAFAEYAAKDIIRINTRAMPTIGVDSLLAEAARQKDSDPRLSWKPLKTVVSASGDLASVYGKWQVVVKTLRNTDTTIYGNYITVWQKQISGKWKFIMDGGGSTPREVSDSLGLAAVLHYE